MINNLSRCLLIQIAIIGSLMGQDGPYAPAAGVEGSTAIHRDSSIIVSWAADAQVSLGYMDINNEALGYANFGIVENALGYSDDLVISLGDNGMLTYTFSTPIINGSGPDFAVFENAFDDHFLEFAFVEVSSNGVDFQRFQSSCLIQTEVQVDGFGLSDPTLVYNLAGKYRKEYGTPFDLATLDGIDGLDINHIIAIRVIDVIGNINGSNVSVDADGNVINDPYPTPFGSSGFDLDAIGIIHLFTGIEDSKDLKASLFPNPVNDVYHIILEDEFEFDLKLFNSAGQSIISLTNIKSPFALDVSSLTTGIYYIHIKSNKYMINQKVIKQ